MGLVQLDVLSTGAVGCPPSLMLKTTNHRILINAGSGVQRVCTENKERLGKLGAVVFTQVNTDTVGGLGGMLLTLSDIGTGSMTLLGPVGLGGFMHSMRHCFHRPELALSVFESSAEATSAFKQPHFPLGPQSASAAVLASPAAQALLEPSLRYDEVVITPIKFLPYSSVTDRNKQKQQRPKMDDFRKRGWHAINSMSKKFSIRSATQVSDKKEDINAHTLNILPSWHASSAATAASLSSASSTSPTAPGRTPTTTHPVPRDLGEHINPDLVMCYLITVPPGRGKFLPDKAKALGLKAGEDFGKLTQGLSVTTPDGRVVTIEDVADEAFPEPQALVVSCPTKEHAMCINKHPVLSSVQNYSHMRAVLHMTSADIIADAPEYKQWMESFPATTQHIMLDKSFCGDQVVFHTSSNLNKRLHNFDKELFPMEKGQNVEVHDVASLGLPEWVRVTAARAQMSISLRPSKDAMKCEVDTSACIEPTTAGDDTNNVGADLDDMTNASTAASRASALNTTNVGTSLAFAAAERAVTAAKKVASLLQQRKKKQDENTRSHVASGVSVTCLGTGSAIPSKMRNVSANLIAISEDGSRHVLDTDIDPVSGKRSNHELEWLAKCRFVMLDCGEGTLGQIIRRFGVDGAHVILRRLDFIWISHMHADHHLGTLEILAKSPRDRDDLIIVGGPVDMSSFLYDYAQVDANVAGKFKFFYNALVSSQHTINYTLHTIQSTKYSDNNITLSSGKSTDITAAVSVESNNPLSRNENDLGAQPMHMVTIPYYEIHNYPPVQVMRAHVEELKIRTGLSAITCVPVSHCRRAYAIVMDHKDGWRFAYSGDTEPSEEFIRHGQGASVLLHEATLDDEMVADARKKKHSTFSEAVSVGRRMRARATILTHFSQRYPKVPRVVFADEDSDDGVVGVGFDLMTIQCDDVERAGRVLPFVCELFEKDALEKEEQKLENIKLLKEQGKQNRGKVIKAGERRAAFLAKRKKDGGGDEAWKEKNEKKKKVMQEKKKKARLGGRSGTTGAGEATDLAPVKKMRMSPTYESRR